MKNWKTTLIGIAAGILTLVANGASWETAAVSVAVAALGVSAKDASTRD